MQNLFSRSRAGTTTDGGRISRQRDAVLPERVARRRGPHVRRFGSRFGISCFLPLVLVFMTGCASRAPAPRPPPPDPELSRLADAARRAYAQAGPERAAPLFREALQRARALDAPSAIRPLAFNLAACLIETEEPESARLLLREAEGAAARSGEPIADILALRMRAALQAGDLPAARAAGAEADRAANNERRGTLKKALALFHIELALAEGDTRRAAADFQGADRAIGPRDPIPLQAHREGLRARLRFSEGEHRASAEAWEHQARLLGSARLPRSVAPALERAAQAYRDAGYAQGAADSEYRAARSWLAQNRRDKGIAALQRARDSAADASVSETVRAAVDALSAEAEGLQ